MEELMKEFVITGLDAVTMNNDREIITDAAVDTAYINGETVLGEGKLKNIDEEWLIVEAEDRARDIVRQAGIRVPCPWPVI